MKKTDDQQNAYIDALVHIEASFNDLEWPSLFSNLIEPRKKDLLSARALYDSLTNEEIEKRFAIHRWEAKAVNIYESLMGCSLMPLGKSIDPRLWAKKETINIGLLLNKGENLLMTHRDLSDEYLEEIPGFYNKLLIGEWESFISIDEISRFQGAESKYLKDHNVDTEDNLMNIDFNILMASPKMESFINRLYFIAMEIQAIVWYREFLKEVMCNGITFYNDSHSEKEQKNQSKRKYINIKELQRTNNGYEAIKANFDAFIVKNDRMPSWAELMNYMASSPIHGFIVDAKYKGELVSELLIEGVEKPLDRDAFRNRYNRYFKKTDIKADIK